MTSVIDRAQSWHDHDPDPRTKEAISSLIDRAKQADGEALAELEAAFAGPLAFGTAGLRGILGAGESRMNRAVIRRTTLGLARYLEREQGEGAKSRGVVVGYDGRRMSRELAEEASRVLAAAGFVAHLSPTVCPTPIVAYAVNKLGAAAGAMVTASHNPPEYNGFKVYWENAAQIIPPHDRGIARAIDEAPPADEVPMLGFDEARDKGLIVDVPTTLEKHYLEAVRALSVRADGVRDAPIVYTPLHGVGDRLTHAALAQAGFSRVVSVPEQAEPDGEFPTVRFPNPEEKGALDLALALAEKEGADLIIAADPDVDRLALSARDKSGRFVQLTGNQVGVLLGHELLTRGQKGPGRVVIASCVSSPQLGGIAEALGVSYEETLTGFKWIANRAMAREAKGERFVFGYEEALGYTVGSLVRDKDGISAAVAAAELWAGLRAEGKTLFDELESIARRFGLWVSGQLALTLPGQDGLAQIQRMMQALREDPPDRIGGLRVLARADAKTNQRWTDEGEGELGLPPSDVLFFDLEHKARIIARPSGTEPKIKIYFDVREDVREGEPIAEAQARAEARHQALRRSLAERLGVDAS